MTRRSRRSWFTWIALWVFALAALAPTASRALAANLASHGQWVEVCSAEGTRWVRMAEGAPASDDSAPATVQLDHCPLCLLMSDHLAPAPVQFQLALLSAPTARPLSLSAPEAPRCGALTAMPRGPPVRTAFLTA